MIKILRQPETLFKCLMWALALLFAAFLTGLGSLVIRDLPLTQVPPDPESYATPAMEQANKSRKVLEQQKEVIEANRAIVEKSADTIDEKYTAEYDNFKNWLDARSATDLTSQNATVIAKTKQLEAIKEKSLLFKQQIAAFDTQAEAVNKALSKNDNELSAFNQARDKLVARAQFSYDLKVFFIRLAFILPLLLLAVWLFVKKRKSNYWPFVWGFIFFSVFAFFVELVPYLPSYGGYIRYIIGIVLLAVVGHYAIKAMQQYLLQRQAKDLETEVARRSQIDLSLAFKKMAANICPSCERGLISTEGADNNFCMHCGLTLFVKCTGCQIRHNTFFQYCPSCGIGHEQAAQAPLLEKTLLEKNTAGKNT